MKLDGDKLRRARERLGYSMEAVGEVAEMSKNSVLRAEHEEDIRPGTARKIADALGVEVAELIADPKARAPRSLSELLERAGVADRHLAMSTPELMDAFEGLSYQEAYELARKIAEARGAIKAFLEPYKDTPAGKMLTAESAERNIVANLSFQVIAEFERGQAAAQGDLARAKLIEKDLKEVA